MALNDTTTHKPEWISLNEAVDQWLALLFKGTTGTLSPEMARVLNSTFSEALRVPEFSIKGIQLDGETESPKGPLVDIPPLHFRHPRTFIRLPNSIEPYHEDHAKDIAFEATRASKAHPEWVDVQVHRASFEVWLKDRLRIYLLDELEYDRIDIDKARDVWAKSGTGNLEGNPDPANFDPMKEVFWTLPMAVAWITWRDPQRVVGHWDKYRSQLSNFYFEVWKSGSEEHKGWILRNDEYDSDNPVSLWVSSKDWLSAKQKLWGALQSGKMIAFGENAQGDRLPIAAHLWRDHGATLRDWKKVAVAAKDVLLITTQDKTEAAPKRRAGKKKADPKKLRTLLETRYRAFKDTDYPPTEPEDWEAAKVEFPKIPRQQIRDFRNAVLESLGLESWIKHGPRKTIGELRLQA